MLGGSRCTASRWVPETVASRRSEWSRPLKPILEGGLPDDGNLGEACGTPDKDATETCSTPDW